MLTLFTLASGRSGTSFLADFFQHNVLECYSTHEPYLTIGNPVLFGKSVYWNTIEDDEKLLPILKRKQQFISNIQSSVYFESNHAILKSSHRHIHSLFDNTGYIHLVRDPLLVAKSELLREQLIRKCHIPFSTYTVDSGERFFSWSLTGIEAIYSVFSKIKLSRLQFYLLQWIEIEYRAMQLIKQNGIYDRVFFIDVTRQLNDKTTLINMLNFFDLSYKDRLEMNLKSNRTPFVGPTIITHNDRKELADLLQLLPDKYLKIFKQPPYTQCAWQADFSG